MNISLSSDKLVARIHNFFSIGDIDGSKKYFELTRLYTKHVEGGGRPCFLNEAGAFKPTVVVSRKLEGGLVHIGAWEDMPLYVGDRIRCLRVGVRIQNFVGTRYTINMTSPDAFVEEDGKIVFRGTDVKFRPKVPKHPWDYFLPALPLGSIKG